MKIRYHNKEMIIADDAPLAQKITQGYDFVINEGNELVVSDTMTGMGNKYQLANAIRQANNVAQLKVILIKMVELLDVAV